MTDRKRKNRYTNYRTGKKTDMKPHVPHHERDFPDNYWKDMYGVSVHAIIRYCQRAVNYFDHIDNALKTKVAIVINRELEQYLHPNISGSFSFLVDYTAIIQKGIVLTIKYKNKDKLKGSTV